jgi:hypothetical protein
MIRREVGGGRPVLAVGICIGVLHSHQQVSC